jgi:hypothetical protein
MNLIEFSHFKEIRGKLINKEYHFTKNEKILGFGILFATFITLLLIPALYIILDDVQQLFKKLKHNV